MRERRSSVRKHKGSDNSRSLFINRPLKLSSRETLDSKRTSMNKLLSLTGKRARCTSAECKRRGKRSDGRRLSWSGSRRNSPRPAARAPTKHARRPETWLDGPKIAGERRNDLKPRRTKGGKRRTTRALANMQKRPDSTTNKSGVKASKNDCGYRHSLLRHTIVWSRQRLKQCREGPVRA